MGRRWLWLNDWRGRITSALVALTARRASCEPSMLKGMLGYQLLHMNEGLTLVVRSAGLPCTLRQIVEEGWDALIDIEAQCDDDAQRVLLVYRLTSRQRAHARLEVQTMIDAGASCPSVKDMFPEAGALEAAIVQRKAAFV